MTAASRGRRLAPFARALLAAGVLHLVLIQPNHPDAVAWRALLLFPWELPVILLGLVALGRGRSGSVLRAALVGALTVIAALKAADFAMFMALNRGFNLVADFPLIVSLFQLVVGAFGRVAALLLVLAAALAVIGLAAMLWWACGVWQRMTLPRPVAAAAGGLAVLAAGIAVTDVGARMGKWTTPVQIPGTAFTARIGVERYELIRDTLAELRAFREAAREDPFARQEGLLDRVDRDVIVIFVESYGRTSFDTPYYADLHLETLAAAEDALSARGLRLASTFLVSPTQGGQSWLAHSSFANGLWIENQTSYRAALASGRKTLFHLAGQSGFSTAAVMPQITMDWPESRTMGFDTILAAADLGYAGAAFNWITMPDQFTFAAMDRLLRADRGAGPPRVIQLATGSSHAPWVPVPELIAWEAVGDGTVYDPIVAASDPPAVVWRDHDRVRAQYRLAIDYALQTVFAYAELHAQEAPLLIILGDHQAAGFVALDERPHVPLHVIGPAPLVEALMDDGFTDGLVPDPATVPRPMSEMRAYLLRRLTSTLIEASAQ